MYKSVGELRYGFADVRPCRGDVVVAERRPERRLIRLFNTGDRAVDPSESAGLAGLKRPRLAPRLQDTHRVSRSTWRIKGFSPALVY